MAPYSMKLCMTIIIIMYLWEHSFHTILLQSEKRYSGIISSRELFYIFFGSHTLCEALGNKFLFMACFYSCFRRQFLGKWKECRQNLNSFQKTKKITVWTHPASFHSPWQTFFCVFYSQRAFDGGDEKGWRK